MLDGCPGSPTAAGHMRSTGDSSAPWKETCYQEKCMCRKVLTSSALHYLGKRMAQNLNQCTQFFMDVLFPEAEVLLVCHLQSKDCHIIDMALYQI